jgi:hypothetical protein
MRVLEARFHPWKIARGPFVVVGRIVFRRRRPVVKPAASGADEVAAVRRQTRLQKLEYLVARCGRDGFHRLRDLHSDFWSFVEVGKKDAG